MPSDLLHNCNYDDIPNTLHKYFIHHEQEVHEADFMITTTRMGENRAKEKIVCNQLDQLGLNGSYEVYTIPDSDSDEEIETVLIAIDIPDEMIDDIAIREEIDGSMTYNLTNFFIRQKFNKTFSHMYNKFMATSRDDIVFELLTDEIDFDYYLKTGVIIDY